MDKVVRWTRWSGGQGGQVDKVVRRTAGQVDKLVRRTGGQVEKVVICSFTKLFSVPWSARVERDLHSGKYYWKVLLINGLIGVDTRDDCNASVENFSQIRFRRRRLWWGHARIKVQPCNGNIA